MLDAIIHTIGSCLFVGILSILALLATCVVQFGWYYIRKKWLKRGS